MKAMLLLVLFDNNAGVNQIFACFLVVQFDFE